MYIAAVKGLEFILWLLEGSEMIGAWISVLCLCWVARLGSAQTGLCQPTTLHACVGRSDFRECVTNSAGQLRAVDAVMSCHVFGEARGELACYGAVDTVEDICGPAPRKCVRPGSFPIKGRCRNFYTCLSSGRGYLQYISECESGFEFSARDSKCMPRHSAGCSMPYPTTEPPKVLEYEALNTTGKPSSQVAAVTPSPAAAAENATTPAGTSTTSDYCSALTRTVDETSCKHYFQCFLFGRKTRLQCPFGMLFDAERHDCRRSTECGTRPQ